jgi:hypothetical protein
MLLDIRLAPWFLALNPRALLTFIVSQHDAAFVEHFESRRNQSKKRTRNCSQPRDQSILKEQ